MLESCDLLYGLHQLKVFHRTPPNTRKVVIATNLAETSVTIAGIVYGKVWNKPLFLHYCDYLLVIDCGFVKLRTFSAKNSIGNASVIGPHVTCGCRIPSSGTNITIFSQPKIRTCWKGAIWKILSTLHRLVKILP